MTTVPKHTKRADGRAPALHFQLAVALISIHSMKGCWMDYDPNASSRKTCIMMSCLFKYFKKISHPQKKIPKAYCPAASREEGRNFLFFFPSFSCVIRGREYTLIYERVGGRCRARPIVTSAFSPLCVRDR